MAEFPFVEFLQAATLDWQQEIYSRKVDHLKTQISQIQHELKHVQDDHEVETLENLGKLRRELAEALWHINKTQDALDQIQLCVSENCHEFSEVSTQLLKLQYH